MSYISRFWEKVDRDGPTQPHMETACWVWTGGTLSGYGQLRIGSTLDGSRRMVRAHRLSWEIHFGPVPEGEGYHGTCVLHRCDNRACVRPDHLFLGSNRDNSLDMLAKGRGNKSRGERQHLAKLTEKQVREIRKRKAAGEFLREIAPDYGVSLRTVSLICRREIWKHVD